MEKTLDKFFKKNMASKLLSSRVFQRTYFGGHVTNPAVAGERIVPMCDSCNSLGGTFTLKGSVSVPSANKSQTCEQKA